MVVAQTNVKVAVPPASETMGLRRAKNYLYVTHNEDDDLITDMIRDSRQYIEDATGYVALTMTIVQYWDGFPAYGGPIEVGRRPLQSVDSLSYTGTDGISHTMTPTDYGLDTAGDPPRITLAHSSAWPVAASRPLPVVSAQIVVGNPDVRSVPSNFIRAQLVLMAHWYDKRADPPPPGLLDYLIADLAETPTR